MHPSSVASNESCSASIAIPPQQKAELRQLVRPAVHSQMDSLDEAQKAIEEATRVRQWAARADDLESVRLIDGKLSDLRISLGLEARGVARRESRI
jgi:hypothetical protein